LWEIRTRKTYNCYRHSWSRLKQEAHGAFDPPLDYWFACGSIRGILAFQAEIREVFEAVWTLQFWLFICFIKLEGIFSDLITGPIDDGNIQMTRNVVQIVPLLLFLLAGFTLPKIDQWASDDAFLGQDLRSPPRMPYPGPL
jgi:hypothetical protein